MLTNLKDLIVNKTRLFIEYLLIGFVVALGGITLSLWLQKNSIQENLKEVQSKVITLETANETNVKTIDSLMLLRNNDATAIEGLLKGYKSLAQKSELAKNKLKELEETNIEIRNFLHSPLPAPIKCLLNKTCKTNNPNEINLPESTSEFDYPLQFGD